MRISDKSLPPRLCSNQSETIKSILTAKKCALGYGKKEDVSKFSFIKDISHLLCTKVEQLKRPLLIKAMSTT